MFGYIVQRLLIMIPTVIAISIIVFVIIQLPPGDYFSTYIAELQSQGEAVDLAKIAFLKAQYGFDKPSPTISPSATSSATASSSPSSSRRQPSSSPMSSPFRSASIRRRTNIAGATTR